MNTLVLPQGIRKRIDQELNKIPAIHGKIVVQLELNCGTQGLLGSIKIKISIEEEVRA